MTRFIHRVLICEGGEIIIRIISALKDDLAFLVARDQEHSATIKRWQN
jgi:hypothetical protein